MTPFSPVFYPNRFDAPQEVAEGMRLDVTTAAEGYIGVSAQRTGKLKAQIGFGETKYHYTLKTDGTVCYLPLQFGSGTYTVSLLQNTVGDKYVVLYTQELAVTLKDELQPFLHANLYVSYTKDSPVAKKAAELALGAQDELAVMSAVYELVKNTVEYDDELAQTVLSGYIPSPDRTLQTGRGICFDYAALAAAMLRSVGVPAKVVTGYVGEEALYHAWNAIYTKESGWIAVELKVDKDNWRRIDITFDATGTTDEQLYIDRYVY